MHLIEEHPKLVRSANKRGELVRQEVVSLVAQRIAQLPPASKKVLAMCYHENMPLLDIAACLGVTESEICQIQAQTIASIQEAINFVGSGGAE